MAEIIKNLKFITYLPFIGWIAVMTLKKDDIFLMRHARQGFVLAVIFAVPSILLSFSMVFIPRSSGILKLVMVSMIYFLYLVYSGICIYGTLMIKNSREYDFPYIRKISEKIDI